MYAIVRTGGKQYKVKAGDLLRVEKLEKNLGDEFDMSDVLFVSGQNDSHFGSPLVKDAKVTAVVTNQSKHPKIIIFKRRRRQGYRRLTGHRQPFTELFIKAIFAPGGEKVVTDKSAPVRDPEKKLARLAKMQEEGKAAPKKEASAAKKSAKKVATKKKTVAKKTATKKKTAKKAK